MEILKKPKKETSKRSLKLLFHLESHGIPTIAKELGIASSRIYNWKYGSSPSLDNLGEIADKIPNIDWNDIMYDNKAGELRSTYVKESEIEKRLREMEQELERTRNELQEAKIELLETKREKSKLFDLLGKDEGETDAYLVDTEVGFKLINLMTIIQQGGFAYSERNN
jgi:hypothetical protein